MNEDWDGLHLALVREAYMLNEEPPEDDPWAYRLQMTDDDWYWAVLLDEPDDVRCRAYEEYDGRGCELPAGHSGHHRGGLT